LGLAWDGDYDRCFFFDEVGQFIEGYYLVGLLAETFLEQEPGARIVHDPRLTWNTLDIVRRHGGTAVLCKAGHAFIKQKMREADAVYGGEMSAHHYFRGFAYCDSGMIPWLLVLSVMSARGQPLSALVGERMRLFPASGEINRQLAGDARSILARVRAHYQSAAQAIDLTDGLSMEFAEWRFNLRGSNTEPLVRLNVESRGRGTEAHRRLARGRPREIKPPAGRCAPAGSRRRTARCVRPTVAGAARVASGQRAPHAPRPRAPEASGAGWYGSPIVVE
jgi:phosphomannomutase